ncbi:MAG: amidase domain-containing protein [Clostridia bacterium]|nr:amidase domain-containing protein [Clostridia bacterium]
MLYAYNRRHAVEYAKKWAFYRNGLFFDFSEIGGNCTNFVSQCILAGTCTMNFTPTFGWYYISVEDRSPAWTGVEFLYNFLTTNEGDGPFGIEEDLSELQIGDVLQLADGNEKYYHTLLVSGFDGDEILVTAQTNDALDRPLSEYTYADARGIHILGYRKMAPRCDCYTELLDAVSLKACI